MRITQRMMTDNAIHYMDENLQRLQALQEKAASGKEFQNASDNPAAATAALSLRSSLAASQSFIDAANMTDDWMTATDAVLSQMLDLGKSAITLTQQGVSDTQGASERGALANELDVLLQQAVGAGNTSHANNYLFAGFKTTTQPFTLVDGNSDGLYDSVTYNGDTGVIPRNLGPGQTVPQNIDGDATFSPLFAAIINARDALNANDSTAIQTALGGLQAALNGVNDANTSNGARQRQVRMIRDRTENTQLELKSLLSVKEDTNMTEAISNLRQQETVYQTVLEVGNRAISALNLFDMLS